MARQAGGVVKSRTNIYLAGAVSGAALIIAAVVAFVPLVSLQAPREWPASGLGIGSHAGDANRGSAVIGEDKAAAPSLDMGPSTGRSVAANRPTDALIGTTETSGKRRQPGGTRGGLGGSLADHSPVVSPASTEGPAAHSPGSHSHTGVGAALPTPSTGTSETAETGDGSSPPTTAKIVASSPGSSPSVDAGSKGQSDQGHAANRVADSPPVPAGVVPRNPDPSPPGAGAVRKLDRAQETAEEVADVEGEPQPERLTASAVGLLTHAGTGGRLPVKAAGVSG